MAEHSEIVASFVLRVFLGTLFFVQGYDKVFKLKISGVVQSFEYPRIVKHVPRWMLVAIAFFTSYAELIGGLLLILGLAKYYALSLIGIDLLLVAAAFSVVEPMWDLRHVFPRIVLLLVALILPAHWDLLSIDSLWAHCNSKQ